MTGHVRQQGGGLSVTLHWPPAPPEHLGRYPAWEQPGPLRHATHADGIGRKVPELAAGALTDPVLIGAVADITALIGSQLGDGASFPEVMPVIKKTARRWLEDQVRAGLLPASAGAAIDELARAVHDQRYGLGPVTAYLRDPRVASNAPADSRVAGRVYDARPCG
jgi:hypothetical protein